MKISIHSGNEQIARSLKGRTWKGISPQSGEKHKMIKEDELSISKRANNLWNQNGGKRTMTERLMEQKQQIAERRSQYISKAMEKDMDPEVIKLELEEFDTQIEEIENQIRKLQLEEQHKAIGMDKESKKEEGNNDDDEVQSHGSINPRQVEDPLASNTMKALISVSNEMKQTSSVKMAQITLNRESKAWEFSDPARSKALKSKAEDLDGKMIEISGNASNEIAHAIEKDKKESLHHHQIESEGVDFTEAVNVDQVFDTPEEEQEPSSKTKVLGGGNPTHVQELITYSVISNNKEIIRGNTVDQKI
ncbi:hypothetical protein [Paenibacillus sp. FSL H7-0331]|uniref:hypothetical protein n=1 Tax=Paenibacillus sp. FSL H7-0331 TaxID=1920421 RepID=UPI00096CB34E|nr:hypothetical protein [Paenibacillus sp. FSL H7-0331]OMF06042.1 hypothetical protein BK127_31340 [Paenibacillus sp. FSL H7-0331]